MIPRIETLIAACTALAWTGAVFAAEPFPGKPIRMIVPYAAGGTGDTIGRAVGVKLAQILRQPLVVENRPGAGGNIGADIAAKSPPDGYTVVLGSTSLASSPALQKLPFDPLKDLAPLSGCCEVPMIVVVHPSLPVTSIKELVAHAKAHPGKLNFSSSGFGTSSHLAAELFKVLTRTEMVHVPYKADNLALADLLSGQINLMFMFQTAALPQVKAGKLRALAVSTARRSSLAADLPTVEEAGVRGYEFSGWFGLFAPSGTPRGVVETLGAATVQAVQSPDLKDRLSEQGFVPVASGPDEFASFFRNEVAKWARVVKEGGLPQMD